jgi:hypothetical protein
MSFDIVIPVGPNDAKIINDSIEYTKKNVIGYRNIYIVTKANLTISNCIIVDENIFPFNFNEVAHKVECIERTGWYLQQLIKLTAGKYIDGILDNYLVLDSDVFILKPTTFMENNMPLFATGTEHHIPYFDHMKKLHPSLTRQKNMSGICHHMMFNKHRLNDLFKLVEDYHSLPFTFVFLDKVVIKGRDTSGASEYEIYFNYMLMYHPDSIIIRNLSWRNIRSKRHIIDDDIYVAIHHHARDD